MAGKLVLLEEFQKDVLVHLPSIAPESLTRSDGLGEKFYNTALVLRFASRHCEQTRIAGSRKSYGIYTTCESATASWETDLGADPYGSQDGQSPPSHNLVRFR